MKTKLRVGTDCSGIDAPIEALKQMKIPFHHVFSSEIDPFCIKSIKANYSPDIIFGDPDGMFPNGDITKRKIEDIPDIDLYICGFPCQTFSTIGKRSGLKQKKGRIFFTCVEVIEYKQPTYFILENVKGLLSDNSGKTWDKILDELEYLQDEYKYDIFYNILNTKDYGIPQNRERLFIIGVKQTVNKKINFMFPKHLKMKNIKDFIDWDNDIPEKTVIGKKYPKNYLIIDLGFIKYNKFSNSDKWSPCLTTAGNLYILPLKRRMSILEYFLLQGFNPNFKVVVPSRQMIKQIGNSMSVNILKVLFKQLKLN